MSFHSQGSHFRDGEKAYHRTPGGVLVLGDCIDTMRCLPSRSVDFILTDPPYLVNYRSRDGRSIANDNDDAWLVPAFEEAFRVLKPDSFCVSFYGWNRVELFASAWRQAGFRIVGHLVFVKSYSSKRTFVSYCHENAYLLAKGNPDTPEDPIRDVLEFKYTGNKSHPNQKPVGALRTLIRAFSKPGATILDPFSGSGSTAIAARLEGREFVAIELDRQYFDIAQQRLEKLGTRPARHLRPVKKAV